MIVRWADSDEFKNYFHQYIFIHRQILWQIDSFPITSNVIIVPVTQSPWKVVPGIARWNTTASVAITSFIFGKSLGRLLLLLYIGASDRNAVPLLSAPAKVSGTL